MSTESLEDTVQTDLESTIEPDTKPPFEFWHPFARPTPPAIDPSDPKSIVSWSP